MPRRILRLRISIDTNPEIWRLIEVDAALTLADLHDVIQIAFGWRDTHLHEFAEHDPEARSMPLVGRASRLWRLPHPDDMHDEWFEMLDESDHAIGDVIDSLAGPLRYHYDFGDSWWHRIDLIEDIEDDPGAPPAIVIRGERRGPLDDSGGPFGYDELLGVLAEPGHPDRVHLAAWADGAAGPWRQFDPTTFDVEHVNRELALRFDRTSSGIPLNSALADFLGRVPPPVARDIRGALSGITAATETETPHTPLGTLLDLAHDPGLELTDAGWLRPALVERIMAETGWSKDWIGKGNREDLTAPVAVLRESAMRLKLLRKLKGRLLLTRAGNAARKSPRALRRAVAASVTTLGRAPVERDATILLLIEILRATPHAVRGTRVAEGLEILGYLTHSGGPIDADTVRWVLDDLRALLDAAGIDPVDAAFAQEALFTPR